MRRRIKKFYIISLTLSILLYAIPFEYGGNLMRGGIALLGALFFSFVVKNSWTHFNKEEKMPILLLFINGLAILHFLLIFISVVINARYLFIFVIGVILALLIFYVVDNRMRQHVS